MKPRSLGDKMGKCWQWVDKVGERQGGEGRGGSGEVVTPRLRAGATWWTMGLPQGKPEPLQITRPALGTHCRMHGAAGDRVRAGQVGSSEIGPASQTEEEGVKGPCREHHGDGDGKPGRV